jgi:hypothetical protein
MGWQGIDIFTLFDFVLAPFYLFIIYSSASYFSKKYAGQSKYQYYWKALHLRMIGCFMSVMMYQYYYHGGDMFGFYSATSTMLELLFKDFALGFDLMTATPETIPNEAHYSVWTSKGSYIFRSANSMLVSQIGAFLGLLTFNSCFATGLILAYFSFIGCWKLFEVFAEVHPRLEKYIAWATLYIPSVFFWGAAGLMKDTITMASIGFFTWSAYNIFFKRRYLLKATFFLVISYLLLLTIKAYIAVAFLPAFAAWLVLSYGEKIKNKTMRMIAKPLFITIAIAVSLILFQGITKSNEKYSPEAFIANAQVMQEDHARLGGSTYTLGTIDPSTSGMLKMAPFAIIVTLFRPYLWEARSPILLISALEGLLFLVITIFVIIRTYVVGAFYTIISEPTVLFCIIFSLVFSFAVGFTAYNFGALARFKIPAIPFYAIALIIMLDKVHFFKFDKEEDSE